MERNLTQTRKVWLVVTEVTTRPGEAEPAQHSYANGVKFIGSHLLNIDNDSQFRKWLVFTEEVSTVDPVRFSYTNGSSLITTAYLRDEASGANNKFSLAEECLKIYEENGQGAVLDFVTNNHPEVQWGYCEPCECSSPINPSDTTCLVCGSIIDFGQDPNSMEAEATSS